MQATDQESQPAPQAATVDSASIGDLARDTSAYLHAWSELAISETRLARASLVRLAFAVLVAPVLVLTICVAANAVGATLLDRWLGDWSSSLAIVLGLDVVVLGGLLLAMRRWWRNLSLPRSRAALMHLIQRMS